MSAVYPTSPYAASICPPCPTCGKKMRQISANPNSEGVNYDFLCSTDGDRLSWQPGYPDKPSVKSREMVDSAPDMIGRHTTKAELDAEAIAEALLKKAQSKFYSLE